MPLLKKCHQYNLKFFLILKSACLPSNTNVYIVSEIVGKGLLESNFDKSISNFETHYQSVVTKTLLKN